ncbi:hypothetical protein Cni_G01173 [Canna indica]|uniref:Uncharacterized protein n=1 Tax=Canna indica TaxID=4628 RepID=A0AAQ3Q1G2_9LILI|nr:hypothetical protein Cni_G01173 [Canna indica]
MVEELRAFVEQDKGDAEGGQQECDVRRKLQGDRAEEWTPRTSCAPSFAGAVVPLFLLWRSLAGWRMVA